MPVNLEAGRVELQVADPQDGRHDRDAPSQERTQAGEQLGERERLLEVVVRAGVQAGDAVGELAARRQHENGRGDLLVTETTEEREAVDVGEAEIEHDDIVRVDAQLPDALLGAARRVHRVPGAAQSPCHGGDQRGVVLDQ